MKLVLAIAGCMLLVCSVQVVAGENQPKDKSSSVDRISVVFAAKERAVLSSQISATVNSIHFRMGDGFKGSETLIQLDNRVYQANLQKTEALLNRAQAHLKTRQNLFKDNAISVVELQDAKAEVGVARANLIVAKTQLEACSIRVPFAGKVVKVYVNAHEEVRPGEKLVEVVNDKVLLAQFLVPAKSYKKFKTGDPIAVQVHETKGVVQGKVIQVGSVIDPASSTIKVCAEVSNGKDLLRAGMRGNLVAGMTKGRNE